MNYRSELQALEKAGRFRRRKLYDTHLFDLASNDYLGLATRKKQFQKAVAMVEEYDTFAPKASMLVNGYHPIHQHFEERIAELGGFEDAIVVGSGFLANISIFEALVRKGDVIFVDDEYHASGMLASRLLDKGVVFFRHNDPDDLRSRIAEHSAKRILIAVEGVYSMSGNVCVREIIGIADEHDALLIVDEAHSSGVLGENLLGLFDHYDMPIRPNYIKMGTLGKAYGSYGAYIAASAHIVSFLENRAKPIIYSTAPSVFDIALALVNLEYIASHKKKLRSKIAKRLEAVREILGIGSESLIIPIPQSSNQKALENQQKLIEQGFVVGAIRQPTVTQPILRLIPQLGVRTKVLREALGLIARECVE